MQEKTVVISGKEVRFRFSAAIPRLYRIKFKRGIFKDLTKLEKSYKGKTDDGSVWSWTSGRKKEMTTTSTVRKIPCVTQASRTSTDSD